MLNISLAVVSKKFAQGNVPEMIEEYTGHVGSVVLFGFWANIDLGEATSGDFVQDSAIGLIDSQEVDRPEHVSRQTPPTELNRTATTT